MWPTCRDAQVSRAQDAQERQKFPKASLPAPSPVNTNRFPRWLSSPQRVPRRDILVPAGGRATCSASLSLLLLASPGLAIRGEPVQRDKGSLDLCLDPLHPSRARYWPDDVQGCTNAAGAWMRRSGLRLRRHLVRRKAQNPKGNSRPKPEVRELHTFDATPILRMTASA